MPHDAPRGERSQCLGPYCTRQRFTALRPGQAIDAGTLLTGVPLQVFHRLHGNIR